MRIYNWTFVLVLAFADEIFRTYAIAGSSAPSRYLTRQLEWIGKLSCWLPSNNLDIQGLRKNVTNVEFLWNLINIKRDQYFGLNHSRV